MKRNLLFFIIFLTFLRIASAQAPQGFSYQAVVRDASGSFLSNQNVSLQISLLKGNSNGEKVYSEVHQTTTSNLGLVNLQIGNGNNNSGIFTNINWGNDNYFIKIELDDQGGTNYKEMGTSQLLAVPYALYANSVQNDKFEDADADSTNEIQTLTLSGTDLKLSESNTISLVGLNSLNYWSRHNTNQYYEKGKVSIGNKADTFATFSVTNNESFISYNKNTALADFRRDYNNSTARFLIYGYPNTENVYSHMRGSVMLYATQDAKSLIICASQPEGNIRFLTQSWVNPSSERMRINSNGDIGIGTTNPRAKLQITNGDIYIENISSGVIMKSPNGQCWKMTVDNTGAPVFTTITCP